jgi:hypothetical protein
MFQSVIWMYLHKVFVRTFDCTDIRKLKVQYNQNMLVLWCKFCDVIVVLKVERFGAFWMA